MVVLPLSLAAQNVPGSGWQSQGPDVVGFTSLLEMELLVPRFRVGVPNWWPFSPSGTAGDEL